MGAGISGLVCATELSNYGFKVTVYDKGRYTGGRLASRDRDQEIYDYGAQYFTARDPRFRSFLKQLVKSKNVSRWNGKFAKMVGGTLSEDIPSSPRYVGVPVMRSLAETMTSAIDYRTLHRVTSVARCHGKWTVSGDATNEANQSRFDDSDYDLMVLGLPASQAAALKDHESLHKVQMRPCIALLLSFVERLKLDFDGISLDDKVISWAARDSSKPGRTAGERWVLHASPEWSEQNFQTDENQLKEIMLHKFATVFDIDLPSHYFSKVHKWRYALPSTEPLPGGCILDRESYIGYCGDWCISARVESAFLSGISVAEQIINLTL